jgi:hypothetical protein
LIWLFKEKMSIFNAHIGIVIINSKLFNENYQPNFSVLPRDKGFWYIVPEKL